MPGREFVQTISALYELGRSNGIVDFADGTAINPEALDCRDIASIGVSDFPVALPPAQVWRIGWSFGITLQIGSVTDYLGLTVQSRVQFQNGDGSYSSYGDSLYLPPEIGVYSGEFKFQSDGGRVIFVNATGATLKVHYAVWAKGD